MKKCFKLLLVLVIVLSSLIGCGPKNPVDPNNPDGPLDPDNSKVAEDFVPLLDYTFDYVDYRIIFSSSETLSRLATYGPDVLTFYWNGMVEQVDGRFRNSLTAQEFDELMENQDFWGMEFNYAYYKDDINKVFDNVFGANRLNVRKWVHQFVMSGITESSEYIIVDTIPEPRNTIVNQLYRITDVTQVDGLHHVTLKVLICEPEEGALDGSKFRDYAYKTKWTKKNVYKGNSFDEALSYYGVDESQLGTMVFAIKETEAGLRIEGLVEESDVVLSDTFGYFFHGNVVGTGSSGLRLRKGPTTNDEIITVIPEGAEVIEVGYNYGNSDWLFVVYKKQYGWVSAEYLEFMGGYAKPVIYLYPEKAMEVDVKIRFTNDGTLTTTYPQYNNGWKVMAHPDGKLIDLKDKREYSYLYWEGIGTTAYDLSKGFVVSKENTITFLQEKLEYLGLTPKEYNEFIVYWLPYLQESEYNLITFQTTSYTDVVKLDISPKPDSMLRVYMVYVPLDKPIEIPEQELVPFTRKGFTVIEWGGALLNR